MPAADVPAPTQRRSADHQHGGLSALLFCNGHKQRCVVRPQRCAQQGLHLIEGADDLTTSRHHLGAVIRPGRSTAPLLAAAQLQEADLVAARVLWRRAASHEADGFLVCFRASRAALRVAASSSGDAGADLCEPYWVIPAAGMWTHIRFSVNRASNGYRRRLWHQATPF